MTEKQYQKLLDRIKFDLYQEFINPETLLSQYEEREQYEKAAIVQNKIQRIQNKINKL